MRVEQATPIRTRQYRMPDWAKSTFRDFIEHADVLRTIVMLTTEGIGFLTAMPKLMRALYEPEEIERTIRPSEVRATFAQREVNSEFPLVYAQAVIALWGALEDMIRTLIAEWLLHFPGTKQEAPWCDIKIKLGDYEALDDDDKADFLVSQMEQSISAPLKKGIGRFEGLLEKVKLGGPVAKETCDLLFEMQQVRNVFAHRRGIADKRFCSQCPGFNIKPGEIVKVSATIYDGYYGAVHEYVIELINRAGERFDDLGIGNLINGRNAPNLKCGECGRGGEDTLELPVEA